MTLKFLVEEADYQSLDDTIKGLYQKQDNGKYQLAIDGMPKPDVDGLKAKNEQLLAEKKREQEQRKALEKQLAENESNRQKQEEENAKKAGDIATLEKSYYF